MAIIVLNNEDKRSVLSALAKMSIQFHKDRMQAQKQVDGTPFPKLAPGTINAKEGKSFFFTRGKGSGRKLIECISDTSTRNPSKNPTMRLIDTGDFKNNAFVFKIEGQSAVIGFSKQLHKFNRYLEAKKNYVKKLREGKKAKPPKVKPSAFTYEGLAGLHLGGNSPFKNLGSFKQNDRIPGTNFFGHNIKEVEQMQRKVYAMVGEKIKANIKLELLKGLNQAHG
jgi:hypothetical protein